MTAPDVAEDDPVGAWERLLQARGQWRDDMRAILAAHADELPHPEDIAGHHHFDLRPDRPFPADEFPTPTGWFWESEEGEPDEALIERTWSDGFVPLRDFGCGQYDVLVLSGSQAGRIWTLTDVGVGFIPEGEMGDRLDHQAGWVGAERVPDMPARRDSTTREARAREKVIELVSKQRPPAARLAFMSLDGAAVRVIAHMPGAIVRNLDISPGPKRKTYDARVHTFPINRPRQVRTVERTGVPADRLGALLVEDL
jgi:hypothetical protein